MGSNRFMVSSELHQHANNHPPMVAMENGHAFAPTDYALRGGSNSQSGYNEHGPSLVPPVDNPYSHSGNTYIYVVCPVEHFHSSHVYDPVVGHVPPGHGKRKSTSICEGSTSNFNDAAGSSQTWTRNVRSRIPELEPPCMTTTHVPIYASHVQHFVNYHVPVHSVNLSANVMSQGGLNYVPYAASHGWASPPDINGVRRETSQFHAGGGSVDINACHHNPYFQGNLASSLHPHRSCVLSTQVTYIYNYTNGSSSSTSDLYFPSQTISTRYSSHNRARGLDHGYRNGRPSMTVPRLPPIVDVVGDHDRPEHETLTADDHFSYNQNSMNLPDQFQDMRPEINGISYEELLALEEREILTADQSNGRESMAVPRLPPILDVIGAHDSQEHETLTTDPDQLYFNQTSMNFPDQFQDMRLDINDMSYEELLALVERVGNVTTGLSEEGMFEALSERVYCSIDRTQEEDSCPVCLEEYKNGEKVGRMKKCGHNYHVDCIKKWLAMKKACPVCRSECSNQA